ncbi:hypothetical protein HDU87_000713 [Geranomyces variabilis]|uniref:Uncharacterized protein n=1 Tax=Geranomyces variabilis TaxID=109894 RepID=A0AAD5TNJ3_9FUNG|nr:hypothetical protein HDU87_000713 [Geranomyces variabilis]
MDVASIPRCEIRMVVTDVDGTLLDSDHRVHARNAAAIRELRDQHPNIPFVIATGKPFAATAEIRDDLNLHDQFAIHINGCLVYDQTGAIISDSRLAPKVAIEIYETNRKSTTATFMYSGDMVYEVVHDAEGIHGKSWLDTLRAYGENVVPAPAGLIEKVASGEQGVQKMLVAVQVAHVEEKRNFLLDTWPDEFHLTQALPWAIELLPLGASKAHALTEVLKRAAIPPENVLAFGDGENDASMLALVTFGVCMANGMALAKTSARYRTLSNDEGGLGAALETIFGF